MNSQEATVSMIATTLSVMSKQLLAVEALARDAARHAHLSLGQSKANAERLAAIAQTATDTLDYVRYTHERVGSLERRAEVTGRVGGQDQVRLTLSTPSDNPLSPHYNPRRPNPARWATPIPRSRINIAAASPRALEVQATSPTRTVTAAGAEVQVVVPCEVQATGPTMTEPTTTEPAACDAMQIQVPVPVKAATVQPSRQKRIKRKAKGKRAKKLKSTEVVSLSSDEALELNADSPLE